MFLCRIHPHLNGNLGNMFTVPVFAGAWDKSLWRRVSSVRDAESFIRPPALPHLVALKHRSPRKTSPEPQHCPPKEREANRKKDVKFNPWIQLHPAYANWHINLFFLIYRKPFKRENIHSSTINLHLDNKLLLLCKCVNRMCKWCNVKWAVNTNHIS